MKQDFVPFKVKSPQNLIFVASIITVIGIIILVSTKRP